MKKPRNPKPRVKKAPTKAQESQTGQTPPAKPTRPSKQVLLAALRTGWGKLVAAFALLGGLQATSTTIYFLKEGYEATKPDIEISGEAKSPFSLPLTVNNKSALFSMYDIDWNCGVENLKNAYGGGISGIGFKFIDAPKYIKPGGSALFPCRIANSAVSATIVPIMKYKTMGWSREFEEKQFTWFGASDPPRWLSGDRP